MRMVVVFFITLLAIPIAQVAIDLWSNRSGPHFLGEPRSGMTMAAGKHHWELEFFIPRIERRPKTG